ncbi:WhiB family transcriptional regulator [Streptomyces sp. ISL-44]|uniref:WhiB family transcriptional regulator n=1 Tax=Streptomyces sp. ISL-44 TaxID=2819184 RepID=UPI001BE810BF|nr:WhiB family transcriptional regulator [Streptomyces sp. ISL-44]MBT2541358.1 WhiB family transcriptional regulator [Streptomyces sp. ISL-44]
MTIPCEANPDSWFSESAEELTEAKEACGFCPVRAECAELGRDEEFGIWGGLSREDRIAAKRFRVIMLEELVTSKIRSMHSRGESISAMARELGIPRKTLADRLRRMTDLAA